MSVDTEVRVVLVEAPEGVIVEEREGDTPPLYSWGLHYEADTRTPLLGLETSEVVALGDTGEELVNRVQQGLQRLVLQGLLEGPSLVWAGPSKVTYPELPEYTVPKGCVPVFIRLWGEVHGEGESEYIVRHCHGEVGLNISQYTHPVAGTTYHLAGSF